MPDQSTHKMDAMAAVAFMLESGTTPMSGTGLDLYKIPTGHKGDFVEDLYQAFLKTDVVEPFERIPVLNHRNPLKSQWLSVKEIDMSRHIKRHVLPQPGGTGELMELAEALTSHPLDRSMPLWECHVIGGLKGQRFAICNKSHHALLDGTSAMARIIGSKSTNSRHKTVRGIWSKLPDICDRNKKAGAVKNELTSRPSGTVNTLLKHSIRNTRQFTDMINHIVRNVGVSKFIRENYLPSAPGHLPFNAKGDFGKSVAAVSLPLEQMKQIAQTQSATMNDVFLAAASGGLYGYLKSKGQLSDSNLIAQVPISLREAGDIEAGNKITMMFVNLGDPDDTHIRRLASIAADTTAKKELARKANKRSLMAYSVVAAGLGAITGMFPDSNQTANVTLSNVPGSKKRLYLMGAEMESTYAFNVLPPGVSLIMVGFSYCDSMDIGLVAHRSAIPDLELLADEIHSNFKKLRRASSRTATRARK